ncbi:MAG: 50S ribosomal protein L11 methyltransferase [Acidobacteriota bacterium]|nr:50S ribosomal protein L11 methyltransferase [Acidobacteriota bacterium]
MNEQNWFALEITISSEAIEAVEFGLNELDALGTEINNLGKAQTETVCVVGYFNEKPTKETTHKHINEALQIYGYSSDAIKKIEWRAVENKDWLAEWKKHWKPTETEKFIIAPTWEKIEKTDKIVIRIEPSMAFGTGTHETTKLCLQAIEDHFQSEMSFFDVGTGTGILAIAASKFQVSSSKFQVVGCDVDEGSIKIARENAELNGVSEKIEFFIGSISESTSEFDFVCANVTADIIIPMLSLLVEKAQKMLVLSGILLEQKILITEKLKQLRISDFSLQTDGEWISVLIEIGK